MWSLYYHIAIGHTVAGFSHAHHVRSPGCACNLSSSFELATSKNTKGLSDVWRMSADRRRNRISHKFHDKYCNFSRRYYSCSISTLVPKSVTSLRSHDCSWTQPRTTEAACCLHMHISYSVPFHVLSGTWTWKWICLPFKGIAVIWHKLVECMVLWGECICRTWSFSSSSQEAPHSMH